MTTDKPDSYKDNTQRLKERLMFEIKTLNKIKARFRSIADYQTEMILRQQPDGTITFVNKAWCDFWGMTEEEAIDQNLFSILSPEDRERAKEHLAAITFENPLRIHEHMTHSPAGEPVWQRWRDHAIFDEQGNLIEYQSVGSDITEQKLAEKALQVTSNNLKERVKELNCFFSISKLFEKMEASQEYVFQKVVELIPPAWQFPGITSVRLKVRKQEFKSKDFKETIWIQSSNIKVNGEISGRLEVFYKEERPDADEGPFIIEERFLIDSLAERLGRLIERKEAIKSLRKSEKKIRRLMEDIKEGYFETDLQGKLRFANEAFCTTLDYSQEEIIGLSFVRLADRDTARKILRIFNDVYRTGIAATDVAGVFFRRDGEELYGELSVTLLYDENDFPVGFSALARNITEARRNLQELNRYRDQLELLVEERTAELQRIIAKQQKTEQALVASEVKYRGLFESVPVGLFRSTREGQLIEFNKAMVDILGFPDKSLLAATKADQIYLNPADREKWAEEVSSKNSVTNYESQCRRHDGEIIWIRESAHAVRDDEGKVAYFEGSLEDITERKQAEEVTLKYYRSILDTLQDPYFEADTRGYITYCNRAFIANLGYESIEDIIGTHFIRFTNKESARDVFEKFNNIFQTKQPIEPFEYKFRIKNGDTMTGEMVASPIIEHDQIIGTRGIIRDITARIKATEELATINYMAEIVSRSLDLERILDVVCKELTTIFEIHSAGIGLIDVINSDLEMVAFHSINHGDSITHGLISSIEEDILLQELFKTQKPVVLQPVLHVSRARSLQYHTGLHKPSAGLIVPLLAREKLIGIIFLAAKDEGYLFKENDVELAKTLAGQIAAGVENSRLHAQTEKSLDVAERDLEIGREIQAGFFPEFLPDISGWEIAVRFQAARQVSGDFYDAFRVGSEHFGIVIADVCDKGVGAALFMVLLRSLLRSFSEQDQPISNIDDLLLDIAKRVNEYIVNTHSHSNMFATLVLGIFNPGNSKFHYVNAGHDPPILIDASGKITSKLEPTGPAFGFTTEIPFEVNVLTFSPGDMLVAYTDGITDAKDSTDCFYTEERLLEQVAQPWTSAFSVVNHLETDVLSHIGAYEQFDDVTLVAVRCNLDDKPLRHTFTQGAKTSNLALFRKFILEACQLSGVDEAVTESLELAVDEICSNLIMHGYQGMETGEIRLVMIHLDKEVVVQIEDTGRPFDPTVHPDPDIETTLDTRELGGLGIFFINEIIDEMSYESQAGVNRLTLRMKV